MKSNIKYKFEYKYIKSPNKEKKNLFKKLFKTIIVNNSNYLRKKSSPDYKDFKILTSIFNKHFEHKIKSLLLDCSDTLNIYDWNIKIEFHRFSYEGDYGINIMAEGCKNRALFHVEIIFDNIHAWHVNNNLLTNINIQNVERLLVQTNIENMYLYCSAVQNIYFKTFEASYFKEHNSQLQKFLRLIDSQDVLSLDRNLEDLYFSTKFLINKNIQWSLQFSNSSLFNTGPDYIHTRFYDIKNISKKDFLRSLIEINFIKIGEDYLEVLENNSFEDILQYLKVINY